jgi:hypothetical protein
LSGREGVGFAEASSLSSGWLHQQDPRFFKRFSNSCQPDRYEKHTLCDRALQNFVNVVNRHRFDADPDPERLSILMPIQIQIRIPNPTGTPSFKHVGVLTFIHISAGLQ